MTKLEMLKNSLSRELRGTGYSFSVEPIKKQLVISVYAGEEKRVMTVGAIILDECEDQLAVDALARQCLSTLDAEYKNRMRTPNA